MRKAFSLISGVLFLAITITAVVVVYQAGMPIVKRMQVSAAIEQMKTTFVELDELIRQIAAEGAGSKRAVQLRVDPGKLIVNEIQDSIYWELETYAMIISPRTKQQFGNIAVGSNLNTRVYEANYTRVSPEIKCYVMENEHLKVYVRKVGVNTSQDGWENFNTSSLVIAIYNKDMNEWLENEGFLEITVDDNTNSKTGNGYTIPLETGYNLPYGAVTAHMNSSYLAYSINFTLGSGADFLDIEAST